MIAAGRLDKTVRLIRPEYFTDDAGQTDFGRIDLDACPEVPAMVVQQRAADQLVNGTVRSVGAYAITIRYEPEITADWRLHYNGRFLTISGDPVQIGRWEETDIVAYEVR